MEGLGFRLSGGGFKMEGYADHWNHYVIQGLVFCHSGSRVCI